MPRLEVEPGQLTNTSGQQTALAGRVYEIAGELQAAASSAADAAGEPGAAGSMTVWGGAWSQSLAGLAAGLEGFAANLGSAADAYVTTDTTALPGLNAPR
jgi:hypothetical protein